MLTPFNADAVIPNAESAYVAPPKLRDYALNPDHPKGRHKVPIEVTGPNGRTAVVISGWYVADADPERRPSLATAYVDI